MTGKNKPSWQGSSREIKKLAGSLKKKKKRKKNKKGGKKKKGNKKK